MILIKESTFLKYQKPISVTDNDLKINLIFVNTKKNVEKASSYGYLDRKDLEYGVEYLDQENSAFSHFIDVYEAVKYAVPEARMVEENGKTIFILRGKTSFVGSNAAIYEVNGVLTEDISYINTEEIISISKLGNQGAAMYGSRAGNGIISIQTR